jgi:acyl carrier protein
MKGGDVTRSTTNSAASADVEQHVIETIYAALEEIDDGSLPGGPESAGPETVLIGDGGLESLEFVTFAVALEENLLDHGWAVSVFDLIPRDLESFTVGQFSERIAQALEARAP